MLMLDGERDQAVEIRIDAAVRCDHAPDVQPDSFTLLLFICPPVMMNSREFVM